MSIDKSGKKSVVLDGLAEPNGVAVGGGYAFVTERRKNRVRRVRLSDGKDEVFASGLNSPFGLAVC